MDVVRKFTNGFFAVYRGKRYGASGGNQGQVGLFDEVTRQQVDTVPIGDLDEWYTTHTVGTYLDEPFRVNAELENGQYWIYYEGGNGIKIAEEWRTREESEPESTFWQEDVYTFMATVPKEQVTGVHEVRQDELGPWREAQAKRESTQ
ncbi:MAG TPA: hypothetical protein VGR06_00530 [Actinophytocola sp.]|jgi:hypothetical protein|uniref:hypothetical protein n=1 Tax=Actinophytocola sp. TaxID=1872138 RepID=UPI002E055398|nr:hypothetical protein [Actinophytocola sp.]